MKRKYIIIILALIIINQLTVLNRNIHMGFTPALTLVFVLGLFCDAVIIYIMFRQKEKERISRELEEIKFRAEKEKIFYQELENRRVEMAKIRHDYNNLITSVMGFIHMGRQDEAKEMLDELLKRMDKVKEEENAQSDF